MKTFYIDFKKKKLIEVKELCECGDPLPHKFSHNCIPF